MDSGSDTIGDALLQSAETAIRARLSGKRLDHSLSVAGTARNLAGIYGVDERKAYLAGLLHDWDKFLDPSEEVARVTELGLDLPAEMVASPALLHAPTGAAAVALEFPGIPQDVIDAIARHTVPIIGMEPLDEVIYISDKIEPLRSTSDAQAVRDLVGKVSLRELYAETYASMLTHLIMRRRKVYSGAIPVWNQLCEDLGEKPRAAAAGIRPMGAPPAGA